MEHLHLYWRIRLMHSNMISISAKLQCYELFTGGNQHLSSQSDLLASSKIPVARKLASNLYVYLLSINVPLSLSRIIWFHTGDCPDSTTFMFRNWLSPHLCLLSMNDTSSSLRSNKSTPVMQLLQLILFLPSHLLIQPWSKSMLIVSIQEKYI